MRNKKATSVRLTDQAGRLIDELARRLGITRTAVLEIAVRRLAKAEGVPDREEADDGEGA